jgi:hypothetical protein
MKIKLVPDPECKVCEGRGIYATPWNMEVRTCDCVQVELPSRVPRKLTITVTEPKP